MAREVHVGKAAITKNGEPTKKFTWYYRFERKDVAPDGRRQFAKKRGFRTRDEALEAGQLAMALDYGISTPAVDTPQGAKPENKYASMTFEDYIINVWIPNNQRSWKSSTLEGYRKKLKNQAFKKFGNTPISAITGEMLSNHFDTIYLDTSTAISSIDNLRSLLSQIFKYAVLNRHIEYNPMISVKKPNFRVETSVPKEKQVRDAISEETLTAIFERFPEGSPAHLPLKLCCMAGLRLNESLGLAWSDVDFEKHRIFVRRQIVKIQKGHELTAREKEAVEKHPELASFAMTCSNPKYDSKRVIPLFPELEELLLRERKRQIEQKALFEENGVEYKQYFYTKATAPSYTLDYEEFIRLKERMDFEDGIVNTKGVGYAIDFVCRRDDGELATIHTANHVSRVVHGKEKEPAISETFNIHSLIHTFASRLRASEFNGSEHLIQEFMGHKSERETKDYMHISESEFSSATARIGMSKSKVDTVLEFIRLQGLNASDISELSQRLSMLNSESSQLNTEQN